MPVTVSAKKALRRDKRRTQVNRVIRSRLKNVIDTTKKTKDVALLPQAYSIIDRAAKKGVIHSNKAARLKSQLSKIAVEAAPASQKTKTKKTSAKSSSTKKPATKKTSTKKPAKKTPAKTATKNTSSK